MSDLQRHTDFLKTLGLDPSRLSPDQLGALSAVENPEEMKAEQTLELFKTLGIDINKFLSNLNSKDLLKTKSRRNAPCPCQSGKKYKRCCMTSKK